MPSFRPVCPGQVFLLPGNLRENSSVVARALVSRLSQRTGSDLSGRFCKGDWWSHQIVFCILSDAVLSDSGTFQKVARNLGESQLGARAAEGEIVPEFFVDQAVGLSDFDYQ